MPRVNQSCCGGKTYSPDSGPKSVINVTSSSPHGKPDDLDLDVYKVVVVGNYGVGKTSIISAFGGTYPEQTQPTIGFDLVMRTVRINRKLLKLQVWDTAGHERFRAITFQHFRKASVALVVFDVTAPDAEIQEGLRYWSSMVHDHCSETLIIAVGNKTDLLRADVPDTEDNSTCKISRDKSWFLGAAPNNNIEDLFFVSARSGQNVMPLFRKITELAQLREVCLRTTAVEEDLANTIDLDKLVIDNNPSTTTTTTSTTTTTTTTK